MTLPITHPRALVRAALTCCLLLMSAAACAQEIKTLAADARAASATLEQFTGLIGDWVGPLGVASFSAPRGDKMVGHLSLFNEDQSPRVDELWIIRPEGDSVLLRQKHYTPALKDREQHDEWAERRLVGIDTGHIYLHNLTLVTAGDSLQVLVQIPAREGAPATRLVFAFKRGT